MKWSLERYFLSLFQTWSYTMQRHIRILKKPLHWLKYEVPQLFSWTDRTEETLTAPFKYLSSDTKVREASLETMKPSSDLTIPGIVYFVFVSFHNDKSVRILDDPIVICPSMDHIGVISDYYAIFRSSFGMFTTSTPTYGTMCSYSQLLQV